MKKLITLLTALAVVTAVSAEINPPHRYIEFGSDFDVSVSNNYVTVPDVMVKDLVIDLNKIAEEMPDNGFDLNMALNGTSFVNINLKKIRLGFSTGFESYGYGNISKELFELIGEGNSLSDEPQTVDATAVADVFAVTSASVGMKFGKLRLKVTPSIVSPLVYAEADDAKVEYETAADGSIRAVASSKINIYTAAGIQDLIENDSGSYEYTVSSEDIWKGSGIDLAAEAEYPILDDLDVGVFTRVPIIPGRLHSKATTTASFSYETDGILDAVSSDTTDSLDDYTYDTSDWSYSDTTYYINRPLRLGTQAAYRPFGSWFTLFGMGGVGIRYPFSDNYAVYPEYTAGLGLSLFGALGVDVSSAYLNQIFIHKIGVMLNVRVLEIDAALSLQGSDFVNSFSMSGIGAAVGVRFGF
ncbi:MAG: hypothetical protein LKF96_12170 [Treponema sp.]|jgi:hypothetical protein|nr:hypothetical protein [Treponema sp.]